MLLTLTHTHVSQDQNPKNFILAIRGNDISTSQFCSLKMFEFFGHLNSYLLRCLQQEPRCWARFKISTRHQSIGACNRLQVLQDSFNLLDLNPEVRRQKKREAAACCGALCCEQLWVEMRQPKASG